MQVRFTWLHEIDGLWAWVYYSWRIAEPVTSRVYDLETGTRWFGFEFIRHDTRTGSVL